MLLSHRHKFIYTKTAKTGGTSIESYFEKYCMREGEWTFSHGREEYNTETGIIGYRGNNKAGALFFNHMSAAMIRNLVGEKVWSDYFKFCVVRNPFDKVLSAFFHFEVYRNKITGSEVELIAHFRNWIASGKGIVIDRDKYMIDNQVCMNDFIKTENMLTDLERICINVGVPFLPEALPKLKSGFRSSELELTDFYDKETEQIVLDNYSFEFEYFKYKPLF